MHMSVADSLLITVLGMGVVFVVLIILNVMIKGLSAVAIFVNKQTARKAVAGQADASAQSTQAGSVGLGSATAAYPAVVTGVRLYDVDVKTAAMVMAVVAYQTSIPLSELRFRSIRAVTDNSVE